MKTLGGASRTVMGVLLSSLCIVLGSVMFLNLLAGGSARVSKTAVLGTKVAGCTEISSGKIKTRDGEVIKEGFDIRGFNYQDRIFKGSFCSAFKDAPWCQPYSGIELIVSWNESYLSNKDCDHDGYLDKHFGSESYRGTQAEVTNLLDFTKSTLQFESANLVAKVVAAPLGAEDQGGFWFDEEGGELAQKIWEDFMIKEIVPNLDLYESVESPEFLLFAPEAGL